ncbi:hypothetical protein K491DRAFT_30459 [Lophiostoma macrostomum CBS 122681]|uniref:Uncharacterized protein n=1 Tax=Lophiostoma macrostomum CBS 122681 TaxID=1314788 RepID=A0A6A6T0J3_9PLEO|nr:hypothetical protein K491DRAFT_30459 [Lophiostoma macrostomum CBS 122681]
MAERGDDKLGVDDDELWNSFILPDNSLELVTPQGVVITSVPERNSVFITAPETGYDPNSTIPVPHALASNEAFEHDPLIYSQTFGIIDGVIQKCLELGEKNNPFLDPSEQIELGRCIERAREKDSKNITFAENAAQAAIAGTRFLSDDVCKKMVIAVQSNDPDMFPWDQLPISLQDSAVSLPVATHGIFRRS